LKGKNNGLRELKVRNSRIQDSRYSNAKIPNVFEKLGTYFQRKGS
jgi:hypothetical protein